jgi:O-antigen/teichoic acid export membrane protein
MLLLINAEKIILTRVSDVTALAYYSVAFNLANVAAFMGGALLQSLVPAFSQLLAPEKREQFMGLLFRVARFNLIVIFPLIAGMFVFSEQFIRLWAGEEFARESTAPFRILAVGLFFYLFSFIPNALLLASGKSEVQARLYWLELLPYIAVTILLVTYYGAIGAALAWAVRVISDCALMSYFGLRSVSVGVRQMASSVWAIGLVGILFIVPMAITMSTDFGIGALAGAFIVTGSLYVVAVGYFLMEKAELAVLFEKLHRKGV